MQPAGIRSWRGRRPDGDNDSNGDVIVTLGGKTRRDGDTSLWRYSQSNCLLQSLIWLGLGKPLNGQSLPSFPAISVYLYHRGAQSWIAPSLPCTKLSSQPRLPLYLNAYHRIYAVQAIQASPWPLVRLRLLSQHLPPYRETPLRFLFA